MYVFKKVQLKFNFLRPDRALHMCWMFESLIFHLCLFALDKSFTCFEQKFFLFSEYAFLFSNLCLMWLGGARQNMPNAIFHRKPANYQPTKRKQTRETRNQFKPIHVYCCWWFISIKKKNRFMCILFSGNSNFNIKL
jgi:hypothetical protein